MRLLGAVLAGGRASRFGADKAIADVGGRPLIRHVADALAAGTQDLVVCGRSWGGLPALDDVPAAGLGPMGGLAAALCYAHAQGHDGVLCAPCDVLGLPEDLPLRLAPGPAVPDGQWLIGLWPVHCADPLVHLLRHEGAIPARRWIAASGAAIRPPLPVRNVNLPSDLQPWP